MDVKVLFFARSRELAGASEGSVTLPKGAGTIQLVESLMEKVSLIPYYFFCK